ncbi:IclR family transcriptional regulator [Luteipulveratus mongoliensis]|uniref:IclR family transcriptional regulator n=1 Tax=Luteipulveratus mongoliensis TaxID=571913 RepID=A0A0K1JQH3_9MICO|nr:helix-turn-helix domain-containing protein [Luteipulveratus mongoliensis]AKU18838.1 IclR family transcriptional regulator [Luteipulveratus mongoliensis]
MAQEHPATSDVGGETSQTMDRGLEVLDLLASGDHPLGMTVTELSAALGVGRPVVYRLVASLMRHDFVVRRDDGRIRLGLGLMRMSASVLPLLRDTALPILRRLADDLQATAHLAVVDRGDAVALAVVEPSRSDLHVSYRVGARHPLDAGAAGRAILLGRESASDATFVTTDGELQAGAHGLAAPVLAVPGLEASIGVVSLRVLDGDVAGPAVVRAAEELATDLT